MCSYNFRRRSSWESGRGDVDDAQVVKVIMEELCNLREQPKRYAEVVSRKSIILDWIHAGLRP